MGVCCFIAPLYRDGHNFCLDTPIEVSAALGGGQFIQVAGQANGATFATILVFRSGGAHRLFLEGAVREAAGADEGDEVTVGLRPHDDPDPLLLDELAAALQ